VRGSGGRLQVVKNTLTRRAAEEAGTESLLALLEGPTAIAFVETEGDPIAVAKALADSAKDTKVLTLRGGILSGRALTGDDVEELAKLPAPEIVKSQLVGVIVAPLTQVAALLAAPLRDLVGLLDARIEQLGGEEEGTSAVADVPDTAPADETPEDAAPEPTAESPGDPEPAPGEPAGDATDSTETDSPAEPAETESEE
jgi:large subunit ribosomal protein L10